MDVFLAPVLILYNRFPVAPCGSSERLLCRSELWNFLSGALLAGFAGKRKSANCRSDGLPASNKPNVGFLPAKGDNAPWWNEHKPNQTPRAFCLFALAS